MRADFLVRAALVQAFGRALAASEYETTCTNSPNCMFKAASFSDSDVASFLQVQLSSHLGHVGDASLVVPIDIALDKPLDGEVKVRGDPADDWLFGFGGSTSCSGVGETAWDNTPRTFTSRVFLPIFLFVITCCVLSAGTFSTPEVRSDTIIANRPRERRCELDFARIVCVACVVIEHSGGKHWTRHNVMFVLQWVLPYLYITSAVAFMLSQKTMLGFNTRLAVILGVGIAANWTSDVLIGRDWQHDFGNTVFQMWYVVMLIAMSTVSSPLRHVLQYTQENVSIANWGPAIIYGTLTGVALLFFIMGNSIVNFDGWDSWWKNLAPLLNNSPIAFIQVGGILFLCHLACFGQANDLLAWVLLAYIYIPRIIIPWKNVGFAHNLELFVFAMVAETWKIRGHKTIQTIVRSCWPILLFFLYCSSIPDNYGRCDQIPANTAWERARFYIIEATLVLSLSARGFQVGDPEGALEWLNYWALYAYCFHVCWARLFPLPYGCVFTLGSIVVFYGFSRMKHAKGQETKEDSDHIAS